MRHHHHHHHGFGERHCRGRGPWGGHGHGQGGDFEGRGRRGGKFGRFMEHGGLRSVILALIGQQPRHGYDLIKELETRSGGEYRPSAGVIYPTLNLLEDEGLIRQVDGESGRKLFELTDAGREALETQKDMADTILSRMSEAAEGSETTRPRIARAMGNLQLALRHRLSGREVSPEQLDAIVKAIDDAAATIEKA
ncbi:PadR family transcriptional regulator [Phenylobacterium deserti]|uniref:PadR family transcriptional regulator n=1 Tax=Phenylobacterium deserti TaxID=1914756 RepID=A0A328A9V2_9CAUL|nr:PadR family transcriptional regulator [Phenylobacterium deserti]RAK51410.1 PadR family transcriptional regulator [Phenylobacterium deserti]